MDGEGLHDSKKQGTVNLITTVIATFFVGWNVLSVLASFIWHNITSVVPNYRVSLIYRVPIFQK